MGVPGVGGGLTGEQKHCQLLVDGDKRGSGRPETGAEGESIRW